MNGRIDVVKGEMMEFFQQNSWIADWIVLIGVILTAISWSVARIRDSKKRRSQIKKLKQIMEEYYSVLCKLNISSMENMNEFDRIKAENKSKYRTCENFLWQLEFLIDHDCNKLKNYERIKIHSILNNFKNNMEFHRRTAIMMNPSYNKLKPTTIENSQFKAIDMRIATIETDSDGMFPTEGIYEIHFKQFAELEFLDLHLKEVEKN